MIGKRKIVVAHMGRVPGVQGTPLHQVKSLLGVGFPLSPALRHGPSTAVHPLQPHRMKNPSIKIK